MAHRRETFTPVSKKGEAKDCGWQGTTVLIPHDARGDATQAPTSSGAGNTDVHTGRPAGSEKGGALGPRRQHPLGAAADRNSGESVTLWITNTASCSERDGRVSALECPDL